MDELESVTISKLTSCASALFFSLRIPEKKKKNYIPHMHGKILDEVLRSVIFKECS